MCCVFYLPHDIATDCEKLYRQTVKVSSNPKELLDKHYSSVTAKRRFCLKPFKPQLELDEKVSISLCSGVVKLHRVEKLSDFMRLRKVDETK